MYFSRKYTSPAACLEYYKNVLSEQDADSPHKYLADGFGVGDGSVIIDAGVAEGNFSLEVIDLASRLIMVECDADWVEALRNTFRNEIASGKAVIVPKMLGKEDNGTETTIDALCSEYGMADFVKMDIEGSEENALYGAKRWLSGCTPGAKAAVCTYHTPDAYGRIMKILSKDSLFQITHTKGYICLNPLFNYKPPYARRGLVRVIKKPRG